MDDLDSFSTVVNESPGKDDLDSFSTVVDEPKGAKARKTVKDVLAQAQDNLAKDEAAGKKTAVGRAVGLFANDAISGPMKFLGAPVAAVGSAVAGGANLLGFPNAAKSIENTVGGTANQRAADTVTNSIGLPQPSTPLEKIVNAGAQAAAGGASNALISGASAAPAAVKALLPGSNTMGQAVADTAIGSAAEAAPTATGSAVLGTVLASAAAKKYAAARTQAKINQVAAKLEGSQYGAEDAQVIHNLANDASDPLRYNPLTGKSTQMTAADLNDAGRDYTKPVKELMKQGGIDRPDLNVLMSKKMPTADEINNVRGTVDNPDPVGDAVADAMVMNARNKVLTTQKPSNQATALLRYGIRKLPMGEDLRHMILGYVGGRETREAAVNKLISDRDVAAADQVLANAPEAPAHMQSLADLRALVAQRQAAQAAWDAANVRTPPDVNNAPIMDTVRNAMRDQENAAIEQSMAPPANIVDLAQRVTPAEAPKQLTQSEGILKSISDARKDTSKGVDEAYANQVAPAPDLQGSLTQRPPAPQPLPEDKGILSTIQEARNAADEMQADHWDIGRQVINEVDKAKQMDRARGDAAKAQAKAEKQAAIEEELSGAGALTTEHGSVINGGSLKAAFGRLENHGLDAPSSKKLIEQMLEETKDPTAKRNLQKLLDNKEFHSEEAFYKTQDSVAKYAESKGYPEVKLKDSPGALSSDPLPNGALSGTPKDGKGNDIKSVKLYGEKAAKIQGQYAEDLAKIKGPNSLSPQAKKMASDVVSVLQVNGTGKNMQARQDAIQELLQSHPEHRDYLLDVFGKYIKQKD